MLPFSEGGRRVAVLSEPLEVNFSLVFTAIAVRPADVQLVATIWRSFSTHGYAGMSCKTYSLYMHKVILYCVMLIIRTLQKIKGYFNPARVISVAASLPKNVHTSSNTFLT